MAVYTKDLSPGPRLTHAVPLNIKTCIGISAMLFIGKQLKQARQLIRQGELNLAVRIAREIDFRNSSFARKFVGRRIANQLIDRLVDRAGRSSFSGDLPAAWKDLIDASSITSKENADRVSRETTRLVDKTIDRAQSLLQAGKPTSARTTIGLLTSRKILDRRANELNKVCDLISQAEQLAAKGKLNDATSLLYQTKQLRPDLTFLDSRIRNFDYQQSQLSDLTTELRFAINQSAWGGAKEVSNKILRIAPNHQVALDAQRRCDTKQANAIKSIHWLSDDTPETDRAPATNRTPKPDRLQRRLIEPNRRIGDRVIHYVSDDLADQETQYETAETDTASSKHPEHNNSMSEKSLSNQQSTNQSCDDHVMKSFMLWIDGVGGFLVCTNPVVAIGRATPDNHVDVRVQADLRRQHLQIKRVEGQYLMGMPAVVDSGDSVVPGDEEQDWSLLADNDDLDLGQGVLIRFKQTHPLGRSARLEFTSRHRTEPWSDAVLLLGDAILLGPDRSNHVFCSRWKNQLVIYRRGNQILLRSQSSDADSNNETTEPAEFEVNGQTQIGDVVLCDGLQVTGHEFSISCEEVVNVA